MKWEKVHAEIKKAYDESYDQPCSYYLYVYRCKLYLTLKRVEHHITKKMFKNVHPF